MKSTESALNELGIDAVTGVELMDWLGVSPLDLGDSNRFSKLHDIISYFKQFPIDTQRFIIRKVTNGKNVDKLQHVWEYAQLLEKKGRAEKAIENVKAETFAMGKDIDPSVSISLAQRETEARKELSAVIKEAEIYEK